MYYTFIIFFLDRGMFQMIENLIEAALDELKNGYKYDADLSKYVCRICGTEFEEGEIFKFGERYFCSERMIKMHIQNEHGDMLDQLIATHKKYTGLTPNQTLLLKMMYSGMTDAEIAKKMGIADSTVRHQKFTFREKAKQAKLYLAIYELAFSKKTSFKKPEYDIEKFVEIHNGAKMLDDRYLTTLDEEKKILETMFSSLSPLKLKTFPAREKKKIIVLKKISEQFDNIRRYSEKEVNEIVKVIFDDFATIRRYLIEYGFLERTIDCREYWRK